jgi:hypothetical protein
MPEPLASGPRGIGEEEDGAERVCAGAVPGLELSELELEPVDGGG